MTKSPDAISDRPVALVISESREAAKEYSSRRMPWVEGIPSQPRKGRKKSSHRGAIDAQLTAPTTKPTTHSQERGENPIA